MELVSACSTRNSQFRPLKDIKDHHNSNQANLQVGRHKMAYFRTSWYLSPWWDHPPPALRCRSSGWCPHGESSHSWLSHRPTASTGHRPLSGWCQALGSRGPLVKMYGRPKRTARWRSDRSVRRERSLLGCLKWKKGHSHKEERWQEKFNEETKEWQSGLGIVTWEFVCWCFYFLCVLFILHNQLSEFLQCSGSRDKSCQTSHYI